MVGMPPLLRFMSDALLAAAVCMQFRDDKIRILWDQSYCLHAVHIPFMLYPANLLGFVHNLTGN